MRLLILTLPFLLSGCIIDAVDGVWALTHDGVGMDGARTFWAPKPADCGEKTANCSRIAGETPG